MKSLVALALTVSCLTFATASTGHATGLYTCESGPRSEWKSQDELKKNLESQGWKVRRIKEDGGCWEVYAINDKGQRVEAYFHPVTLKNVFTSTR